LSNIIDRNIQRSVIEVDSKFGKKSGYGITHSINSLIRDSFSMEPKSIAFYTAVAIGILAVLSATIFPTLVQRVLATTTPQPAPDDNEEEPAGEEEGGAAEAAEGAAEQAAEGGEAAAEGAEAAEAAEEVTDETTEDDGATGEGATLEASDGMVSCGEVITEDTTLQQDLTCPDDGVIIRGSGIEFNMNGHTISSTDEDDSVDLSMDLDGNSGILVSNADDVTITGLGKVSGFSTGVRFTGSSGAVIEDVALTDNGVGALVSGSTEIEINKNSVSGNSFGIVLESSDDGVISFNQVTSNLEAGIVLLDSDRNTIAVNTILANGETGIFVDAQSTENVIDYNTAIGHDEADMNNANGMPTNINDNSFGENNNCGTSTPAGLC
jgi:parallel beta-helix repeat protein